MRRGRRWSTSALRMNAWRAWEPAQLHWIIEEYLLQYPEYRDKRQVALFLRRDTGGARVGIVHPARARDRELRALKEANPLFGNAKPLLLTLAADGIRESDVPVCGAWEWFLNQPAK